MTLTLSSSAVTFRRWVLFMDGATRAAILPFGPILLGRLLYGGGSSDSLDLFWDSIAWYTATLVVAYMLGHAIGALVGHLSPWTQRRISPEFPSSWFYRIVGIIVALHVFSFGTAVQSHATLVGLRFMSGLFMGLIHRATSLLVAPKFVRGGKGGRQSPAADELSLEMLSSSSQQHNVANPGGPLYCLLDDDEPEVCKHWLAGFAISIVLSGIIYRDPLKPSGLFLTMFTPGESHGLVPLFFFMAISALVEITIRRGTKQWRACFTPLFRWIQPHIRLHCKNPTHGRAAFCRSYSSSASSMPVLGGILRRRKGTEDNNGILWTSNYSWNRDRLDSNNSKGTRTSRLNSTPSMDGNRSRMNSNMSNDLFYDCSSDYFQEDQDRDLNDLFEQEEEEEDYDFTTKLNSIAKYSNGKCIYEEDQSPAPVPAGTSLQIIPRAYKEFFGNKCE